MTTITAPAGLIRLSAPLPVPRRFTLLDAAGEIPPDSERWLAGAWLEGFTPGAASTHDPCSTGTYRVKNEAGVIPSPMYGAFTVYLPGQCTSASIGPDPTFWTDRLRLAFEAVEAAAVERVLATGDGHATLGPFLTDANLEDLTSGTAVTPVEGLALLEEAIAEQGGGGIIHAPPGLVTYWSAQFLVMEFHGQLQTVLGTKVAAGAGYMGAGVTTSPGEEWAYATGPIQFFRGQDFVNPADYSQALDRNNNDVIFIAERNYLLSWVGRQDASDPDHVQAGVLIDRTIP